MWEKLYYDFRKLNSFGLGFNIPFINLLCKIVDESIIRKINFYILYSYSIFSIICQSKNIEDYSLLIILMINE